MSGLPTWISAALASKLENVARGTLRSRAQAISETYRAGGASTIIRDDLDALAYAVVRMPATYAAVHAALHATIDIIPDFKPQSMLDVGAGPGTASWAALDIWPSLQQATLIDNNPHLLGLARVLRSALQREIAADIATSDLARLPGDGPDADVVMASYALTELAPPALGEILDALWHRTGRLLVIVEPGTMDGFQRILKTRDLLIARGATIVAPCSHDGRCPLADNARWCHFAARLARSRDHMIVKDAHVPFEDEKFSYLVAGKGFTNVPTGRRILATPKVSKAGVTLTLCAPDQVEEHAIPRRDKEAYKAAKRLDWGDLANVSVP